MTVAGVSFGEWREHLPSAEPYVYFLGLLLIPIVLITKNSNDRLNGFFSYLDKRPGGEPDDDSGAAPTERYQLIFVF